MQRESVSCGCIVVGCGTEEVCCYEGGFGFEVEPELELKLHRDIQFPWLNAGRWLVGRDDQKADVARVVKAAGVKQIIGSCPIKNGYGLQIPAELIKTAKYQSITKWNWSCEAGSREGG